MPPRFYFDLTNGLEIIRDHHGIEVRDLDQAVAEARAVLEETRDSKDLVEDEEGWVLTIRDAAGETLMTLPVIPRVPTPVMAS